MSEILRNAAKLAELDILTELTLDVKKVAWASEGGRTEGLIAYSGQTLAAFSSAVQSEISKRKRIIEGYLSLLEPKTLQEASALILIANARLTTEACDSSDDDRADVHRCLRSAIAYLIESEPKAKEMLPGYSTPDMGIKKWDLTKAEMCCESVRYGTKPAFGVDDESTEESDVGGSNE